MRLKAFKANIIQDLFVRTADENYITARWCSANALHTDFLWLALHTVEKYLKAALLMNGRSARGFSHDIDKLYAAAKELAGALLPERLPKPDRLDIPIWIDRTTHEFIAHLMRFGNADNRYLLYGYNTFPQDLHMLDQLVWAIRRLIVPLGERIGFELENEKRVPTFGEVLTKQPSFYFPNGMLPLDNLIRLEKNTPLRVAALNLNFPFAPSNFQHAPTESRSASLNPAIYNHIFEPLAEGGLDQVEDATELADWLIQAIPLPNGSNGSSDIVGELKGAVAEARRKLGLR